MAEKRQTKKRNEKDEKKETIIKELRGIPPDRPLNRFTLTVKGYESIESRKMQNKISPVSIDFMRIYLLPISLFKTLQKM